MRPGVLVAGSCVDLSAAIDDTEGAAKCIDAAVGHVSEFQIATDRDPPPVGLLVLCHRLLANTSEVFRIDRRARHAPAPRQLRQRRADPARRRHR